MALMADDNKDKDFKYIVRIAATDLDGNKPTRYALTGVRGIHNMVANAILKRTGVDGYERIGKLPDDEITKLDEAIQSLNEWLPPWMRNRKNDVSTGKDIHLIGADIEITLREDINLMRKIRCYRGIRHEQGQPVRGQRTKSNKRRGLTVGVQRRKLLEQQKQKTEKTGGK